MKTFTFMLHVFLMLLSELAFALRELSKMSVLCQHPRSAISDLLSVARPTASIQLEANFHIKRQLSVTPLGPTLLWTVWYQSALASPTPTVSNGR
jgi:hypothetical protein